MKSLSLLIVDDHNIVSQGIAALLAVLSPEQCRIASSAAEAQAVMAETPCDLVVLDLELGRESGAALAAQLRQGWPQVRIIVYTMHEEVWALREIQELAPQGVVLKSEAPSLLQHAVSAVAQGATFHSPRYQALEQELERGELGEVSLRVLSLIAQGLSSKEIADRICLSESTIEYHRKRMMRYFHARNIAQLISQAMREGYLR